jgi:manganese/iron transport system ATP-binding protein
VIGSARPILDLDDVTVRYATGNALESVSMTVSGGEHLAVVGPNGAGKTTLFKVIAGLTAPSAGHVVVHGHAAGVGVCVAYVPQRSEVDWTFPVTVADAVLMGRAGRIGPLRRPGPGDRGRVRECLDVVGLSDHGGRQIGALSGGEQQRMFIARALAQDAELVLMDEPLSALDTPSRRDILEVLGDLRRRGISVMVAIHDLDLAGVHFDRVLLLNRRRIALGPASEVLTEANLAAAYGNAVHAAEPPAEGRPPRWTAPAVPRHD